MKNKFKIFGLACVSLSLTCASTVYSQDALHIDKDGNVGIGTDSPKAMLDVVADISCDNSVLRGGHLVFYTQQKGHLENHSAVIDWGEGGDLIFRTNNTPGIISVSNERMRIKSSGNVGIGTDNPQKTLDVNGDARVSGNTTLSTDLTVEHNTLIKGTTTLNAVDVYGWGHFGANNDGQMPPDTTGLYVGWNRNGGDAQTNFINNSGNDARKGGFSFDYYKHAYSIPGYYAFGQWVPTQNFAAQINNLMTITHDGSVGIGTPTPGATLEVNGTICGKYVGIGTPTPQAPLEVNGINCASQTYNNLPDGACEMKKSVDRKHVSVLVHGTVQAWGYQDESDARIKKDIRSIQLVDNLSLINKLRVVDYHYKDFIEHGNITKRGFIAQEVETVFPQAVQQSKSFVPDIFMLADKIRVTDGKLIVTLKNAHNLSSGDTVRLILGTEVKEVAVAVIDEKTFYVAGWDEPIVKSLFIYGKKVNDFRTVDYDQIFSASVGAIQELSKKVAALEAENEALETKNATLEKRMHAEEETMNKMEARLDAVEDKTGVSKKTAVK